MNKERSKPLLQENFKLIAKIEKLRKEKSRLKREVKYLSYTMHGDGEDLPES